MEQIAMYMTYNYKGSTNCTVFLQDNKDGTISVITGYGEVVAICASGHGVAKVLNDLDNDKYD